MAWVRKRTSTSGPVRYQGCYRDARGRIRSVGIFPNRREAIRAAVEREALLATGRLGNADVGKLTFALYVEERWFPHHVVEASTKESYRYLINRHLLPFFGPMRLQAILPSHVREWVTDRVDAGCSPSSIRTAKTVLSAIFTTALNDQVMLLHPCSGVRTPPVPRKELQIVTPEQYEAIRVALPDDVSRLVVDTFIESGLRWGELTELRPKDLDPRSRILTVSRAVVQVDPKFHPQGLRFHVKPYPKSRLSRRLKLSSELVAQLLEHAARLGIGADDLLFTQPTSRPPRLRLVVTTDLGLTEPNDAGRSYPHGSTSAYTAGGCRCEHCRTAIAVYRSRRRADGKDGGLRPRQIDSDGHLSRDWFTRRVWKPTLAAVGLEGAVRIHDLRHSHASWLLAGGANLQVVKERLGHASIATTERYLHTLPEADDSALEAFSRSRDRR
jgi:integrase